MICFNFFPCDPRSIDFGTNRSSSFHASTHTSPAHFWNDLIRMTYLRRLLFGFFFKIMKDGHPSMRRVSTILSKRRMKNHKSSRPAIPLPFSSLSSRNSNPCAASPPHARSSVKKAKCPPTTGRAMKLMPGKPPEPSVSWRSTRGRSVEVEIKRVSSGYFWVDGSYTIRSN